jgi:hypothetical protein
LAEPASTPERALAYLRELSREVRTAILLDSQGRVAACMDEELADRLHRPAVELFARADAVADDPPSQVEVSSSAGAVFAAREDGWSLVVVAGRLALPSLMFYDMRTALRTLEGQAA